MKYIFELYNLIFTKFSLFSEILIFVIIMQWFLDHLFVLLV